MITAVTIADSIYRDSRITTLELEYPRFIHSEFMTHRLFSRNAASSRAIPSKKMREQVWKNPAMPVHFGLNQSGMQAQEEVSPFKQHIARALWRTGGKLAVMVAWSLSRVGLHKQLSNRVLEPWQMMKTVVTSTEWANFMWLRNHSDAQPEIQELAKCIQHELETSKPRTLKLGEWHLPYVSEHEQSQIPLDTAKAVSASCCAQVSYRLLDVSITKARKIYEALVSGQRVHASPFEHQATPIEHGQSASYMMDSVKGVTHLDHNRQPWSGNLKGWVQHRQLIEGHAKW